MQASASKIVHRNLLGKHASFTNDGRKVKILQKNNNSKTTLNCKVTVKFSVMNRGSAFVHMRNIAILVAIKTRIKLSGSTLRNHFLGIQRWMYALESIIYVQLINRKCWQRYINTEDLYHWSVHTMDDATPPKFYFFVVLPLMFLIRI